LIFILIIIVIRWIFKVLTPRTEDLDIN
jgi:hypothetical protein